MADDNQSPVIALPDDFENLSGNEQNKYIQPALTQQAEKAAQSGKSDEGWGKWALEKAGNVAKGGASEMWRLGLTDIDLAQKTLAEHGPAGYKKRVEDLEKAWQAATPEQRKHMSPPYMLEDPNFKALATPPSDLAGSVGTWAADLGEQIAGYYLTPWVEGATIPARLARIGQGSLTGGIMNVLQSGDWKKFLPGAAWGGTGQGISEVARIGAPEVSRQTLGPWPSKTVKLRQIKEAAERQVKPGEFIPISEKGLGKLKSETDAAKKQIEYLTKQHPTNSKVPIDLDELAKPARRYTAMLRRSFPDIANEADKALDTWLEELGYKSAGQPKQVGTGLFDQNGKEIMRTVPGAPAQTQSTVGEVQQLKEDMREGLGKWANTDALPKGTQTTMRLFQNSMQKGVEDALPGQGIANLNKIAETNQRLKEAIFRKMQNNPKWLKTTLRDMMVEAGASEFLNRTLHSEGIGDPSQIISPARLLGFASAVVSLASRNPRFMNRLVYSLGQEYTPAAVSTLMQDRSPAKAPASVDQPPVIDLPDNFLDLPGDEQNKIIQSGGSKAETQPQGAPQPEPQAAPEPARPSPFAGQPPIAAPKAEPKAVPPIASRPSPRDQVALDRERRKGVNLTAGWKQEWDQALVDAVNKYNAGQQNPKDKMPLWLMRLAASQEASVAASQAQNRRGGHTTPLTVRSTVHGRPGAVGLMQIMPATGAQYGYSEKDLEDPRKNTDAAVREMGKNWSKFHRADLALAAYNAGPGTLQNFRYNFSRLPQETREYVQRAIGNWFAIGSPSH